MVAEAALADVADSDSETLDVASENLELGDMRGDLCGVSSKTAKRRRAPGQERPR